MNEKRRNCLKVIVVFILHLLVNCAQISVASYHVTLIFPPARYAENNSLVSSNSQHSCQAHYKANGRLTHLQPGSKVNVTWLQFFPLKTVYQIDLRDDSDKTVARLKHEDLNNSKQNSTKHQMIQLPSKFTCVTCTLRLDVWSDATPYLKPNVFSSCADVQITPLASLEGETTLRVMNDCWNSSDCSENGICSDASSLHRECFCNPGWFGRYCENESLLKDFNDNHITDYIHHNLSGRFQLYHRIEQAKGEIELVLRATGSPLVGIGWVPSGSHCQILSPPNSIHRFQSHSKNILKSNDPLLQGNMVDVAKAGVPVKGLVSRYQKKLFPHHPHSFGNGDGRRHSVFRRILTPATSTPKLDLLDASNTFLPVLPYGNQMMTKYQQLFWRKADDEDNYQEMEDSLFNPLIQRTYLQGGKLKLSNNFYSNPAYVHHRFDRSTGRLNKTENETPAQRNASGVHYVLSSSLNRMTPDITVKEKTTQRISSKMFPFDRKVSLRNTPPQVPPRNRNFDSKVENLHPVSCTELLIGNVLGFRLHIARCSLTDEHPPQLDCTKSKIENILTAAYGFETNGITTVVFRKKLDGLTNEIMDVVWMTGQVKDGHRSLSPGHLLDVPYGKYQLEIHGNYALNFFADGHQNAKRRQLLSSDDCPMVWQSCSQKINCGFRVVWVVNPERKEIRFIFRSSLDLMAFRWMGIGFSKDARLAHSDILIVWVGVNGQPKVLDSHLSENGTPEIKESQDVFDVSADVDNDDKLIIKFSRNLITSDDSHDFGFVSNSTCAYLFYAYGGVSWDGQRIGHSVEQVFTPQPVCLSSCPGLFQTFHLSMKIDSLQWNENLRHKGNKLHAELKEDIEDLLDDIFDDIDGFDSVDIISFGNGSILVDFLLKLTIPVLRPHDMSSKLNILEELTNQVNTTFNGLVASGNLGLKYILDKSYHKMTQIHEASSSVKVKKNLRTIQIGIGVAVALTICVLLASLYKCSSRRLKTKQVAETSLSEQNVWSINVRNTGSRQLHENEIVLTDMLNTPSSIRLGRDPVAEAGNSRDSVPVPTEINTPSINALTTF